MKTCAYLILSFESLVFLLTGCKQQFIPPGIKSNLGYLVVDGVILNGQDTTTIRLSRSQNVTDSTYIQVPETGALITIIGQNSETYPLIEKSNGAYSIGNLNLNSNEIYRLKIMTSNGNEYLSDSLSVKYNPPIDSISWKWLDDGVYIYANTHDPSGSTRYYRWEYIESWENHTPYTSAYKVVNGGLVQRTPSEYVNICWTTRPSTNLLLGSTEKLEQDLVFEYPVMFIPSGSQKLSVGYYISVNQYSLPEKAFNYWQLLQKSTEQTGSLFDPQPTQLNGNIHNVANNNEEVLGYVSITSKHQQSIFISNEQVPNWPFPPPGLSCSRFIAEGNWSSCGCLPLYTGSAPNGGTVIYAVAPPSCGDCTLQGGITTKPSFWPN